MAVLTPNGDSEAGSGVGEDMGHHMAAYQGGVRWTGGGVHVKGRVVEKGGNRGPARGRSPTPCADAEYREKNRCMQSDWCVCALTGIGMAGSPPPQDAGPDAGPDLPPPRADKIIQKPKNSCKITRIPGVRPPRGRGRSGPGVRDAGPRLQRAGREGAWARGVHREGECLWVPGHSNTRDCSCRTIQIRP